MPNIEKDKFIQDSEKVGTKINPVPVPETEIGVDTANEFFKDIANLGDSASIDISSLNTFTQLSQNRETLYQVLDTMAQDSTVAAILEIYAEDATETNERGEIVWSESSDPNINKYITYLLKSLNVDKNMYKWVYSLCKYGDLYLKLFPLTTPYLALFPPNSYNFIIGFKLFILLAYSNIFSNFNSLSLINL